jgi:hypothetical protein
LFGQWSTPVNLGIAGIDDKYPQALRGQVWLGSGWLWMVWQAYVGGDWEIYSRWGGQGSWSDTLRVTNNSTNDQYPCVALDSSGYCWCAWQNDSAGYSDICVARNYPWSSPMKITNDITADRRPSITVVGSTVWVAWRRGSDIYSSSYNGTTWTAPIPVAIGATNSGPKISARSGHPIVVWERWEDVYSNIYYSEYISNAWQTPRAITSDSTDARPEIAYGINNPGVYVYWQSKRDGNFEIYRTGYDSLATNYRVTNNDSMDANPCPLSILYLVRINEPELTFMSLRKGNPDIYHFVYWNGTVPVDTNPSSDSFPVLTADRRVYKWVLWQTNRNGNSDIYGSYNYAPSEVMENISKGESQIEMTPNPFHDRIMISLGKNIQPPGIIRIYDAAGKAVKNIPLPVSGVKTPIIMTWDGTTDDGNAASPGIYFVLIKSNEIACPVKIIKF